MSLGWQTESALLPSRAKPIHVDNKSMVSLKALVSQQEQQRRERQTDGKTERSRLIAAKKRETERESERARRNDNTDKHDEEKELSAELKAQRALEAKARLYDELARGVSERRGEAENGESSLIDFSAKRPRSERETEREMPRDGPVELPLNPPPEPSSSAKSNNAPIYGHYGPEQWQWQTTSRENESERDAFRRERQRERQFQQRVEHCVEDELQRERDRQRDAERERERERKSGQARVRTQWEKTLESSARGFIDEVHREAQRGRAHGEEVNSAREQRLELLKRKREKLQRDDHT